MPAEVIFFNVGQGDCTFLWFYEVPGGGSGLSNLADRVGVAAALIDCGGKPSIPHRSTHGRPGTNDERTVAHIREVIADRLARNAGASRGKLDYLFLSHSDADHYNLLEPLLCNAAKTLDFGIQDVWYTGDPREFHKGDTDAFTYKLLEPGEQHRLTNGAHRVVNDPKSVGLYPANQRVEIAPTVAGLPELYLVCSSLYAIVDGRKVTSKTRGKRPSTWTNAASLVFMLRGRPAAGDERRQKVLLMADAERGVEDFLRESDLVDSRYQREKNLWLKAGHHGSAEATSKDWLDYTTPDALFFSSGLGRFGGTGMPADTKLNEIRTTLAAHSLPQPVIAPTQQHPYGSFQRGRTPPFVIQNATEGICTTLAEAPPPSGRDWLGVDWHLILDDPRPGDYHLAFV
ncbi:hypothetical protein AQI88_31130 [Streptomyces cellostaticus]|uniref:Metallo-beta-lactamase domain-containing protein n=1 Tax=Streptomyces cellostaticus TaxID=67285 RepID=A0A101NG56_9ACTN|nr:hypothetical protein [Streptomyces cellostaticus]KUM92619.1 hypothetical protein AQI88_31130 [Streptomyces cellostaticus]GHI10530.1 hypothetical protein Scel_88510 [Streptomyces cellostaticus]